MTIPSDKQSTGGNEILFNFATNLVNDKILQNSFVSAAYKTLQEFHEALAEINFSIEDSPEKFQNEGEYGPLLEMAGKFFDHFTNTLNLVDEIETNYPTPLKLEQKNLSKVFHEALGTYLHYVEERLQSLEAHQQRKRYSVVVIAAFSCAAIVGWITKVSLTTFSLIGLAFSMGYSLWSVFLSKSQFKTQKEDLPSLDFIEAEISKVSNGTGKPEEETGYGGLPEEREEKKTTTFFS